jgi:ABC-type antimicrobial peptide transport system permease subunit
LACLVAPRRKEFASAWRSAETVSDIFRLVRREGALLTATGVLLGMAGNLALGGVIRDQLYEVRPLDPVVLLLVVSTLGTVALVACALPARRATQVNPATVLTV